MSGTRTPTTQQQQQQRQQQQQQQRQQQQQQQQQQCKNCEQLKNRVRELEHELVALRKLEEDNILLASENEKLIDQLEIEKQKLHLMANNNFPDDESKLKLEELHNEKSPSKIKENSKKYLKKRVSQLESDCKDLWRKLQSEVLKGKQQELEINREATEKERILHALHKAQIANENESRPSKTSHVSLNNSNNDEETTSINEDKDNDYFVVKEKLKKAQNRAHLLQVKILFYLISCHGGTFQPSDVFHAYIHKKSFELGNLTARIVNIIKSQGLNLETFSHSGQKVATTSLE